MAADGIVPHIRVSGERQRAIPGSRLEIVTVAGNAQAKAGGNRLIVK